VNAHARQRGFTLVELVVVIVVLSVLAALAAPRLLASSDRKGRTEAEAVTSLLTQAARRQMLTTVRVAVDYDQEGSAVRVVSLKPGDYASFDNRERVWVEDPLLPRVNLEELDVVGATSNTAALEPRRFRAELSDPGGRVAFSMVVRDRVSGAEWTILLPLTADHAVMKEGRNTGAGAADPDTIDLDDAGRRDSPW
jgi:prepilin-type N-terminal cleavage/methylation domain-containing protein